MNNSFTSNIPSISTSMTVDLLTELYVNAIKKEVSFRTIPSVFLWGSPGVGKSQAIRQAAKRIEAETGKRVCITDVRLLLFNPIDLRGIPTANADKTLSVWLKPKIFEMDESRDTVNILFLDELSSAPQSVQAAAYQICLDRKIGEHKLPENCIVTAAGNRTTDQSVSYKMPKALANRLMHFEIVSAYESWREWALNNEIDSRVMAYLHCDHSRLCTEPEHSELAFSTPRAWETVSNILKITDDGNGSESVKTLVAGLIGNDAAFEFFAFCNNYINMPSVDEIKKGKCREYPKTTDTLFALNSALVDLVRKSELTDSEIDNICNYVSRFPKDYIFIFVHDVNSDKKLNKRLLSHFGFQKLVSVL